MRNYCALFLAAGLATDALAAEELLVDRCQGQKLNPHNDGASRFHTTSRVFRGHNVEVYQTCVQNETAKAWLWVDWYIPGPSSYVPPSKGLNSPRWFLTRETQPYEGCLEFGNYSETRGAHFLGHVDDQTRVDLESEWGCERLAEMVRPVGSGAISPNFSITSPIHLFFSTSVESPVDSMLSLTGSATLTLGELQWAQLKLDYRIDQATEAQEVSIDGFRLAIVNADPSATRFADAGSSAMEDHELAATGYIDFTFDISENSTLTNARVALFEEQSERYLAAFFVPALTD